MKKKTFTLSVMDEQNLASLNLSSDFGKKTIRFDINDSNAVTIASEQDLQAIAEFIMNRLNAVETTSSNTGPSYDPTGIGLCVFNASGEVLEISYDMSKSVNEYRYEVLAETFPYKNAIYVLFTLYDGSIGRETLVKVMQACIQHQLRFVVTGNPEVCLPMKLEDVANKSGLDTTSVSRCTKDVCVYGPRQTFTLDNGLSTLEHPSLFDEPVLRYGLPVARLEVAQRIKTMIEKEDPKRPLADLDICETLKEMGYEIERRTVAKYRIELLNIPSSHKRRQR